MDFAQFMLMLLVVVKCHTNFDTYKKTSDGLQPPKVKLQKGEFERGT